MRARTTPLVLLEASTLLSATGNGIAMVALPWLILDRTGSATAAGVVAAATAVPLLFASLFAGWLVDRIGRRRTAVLSDLASAASVAAIPLVDAAGQLTLPVLAALAVLGAVIDPAGVTARETLLPAAARAAHWRLDRVNGVHEAVFGLAFLVGPGVGGVLIGAVGPVATLWATAAGFVLSLLLVALVRLPGAGRPAESPAGVWRATREGLAFVWHDRLLRTIALLTMALVALYLPVEAVILPAQFVAEGAPERLGLVVMALSGGGVVGALLFGAVGHRFGRRAVFVAAVVGACAALLGMATLPPYPLLVALAALVGLLYGPVNPIANYAMQIRTPERLRGRVVGVMTSSAYAAGPVGYLVAGPLVEWLGVRPAFLTMAAALLVAAVAFAPSRALRELDAAVEPGSAARPASGPAVAPAGGHAPGTPVEAAEAAEAAESTD
ncbi:MAG TPA: MFS transporter [Pseudonocardia sp.]|nr:MFS transporter [Pseudonocardia sp.]